MRDNAYNLATTQQKIALLLNSNMINFAQKGVFDLDMAQEIMAPPMASERTIRLMDRLLTRGSDAYHHFMDVLKLKYDFLYNQIREMETCKFFLMPVFYFY